MSDSHVKQEVVPMAPDARFCIEFPTTGVAGVDTVVVSGQDRSIFDHLRGAVVSGLARGDATAVIQAKGRGGKWTQRTGTIRTLPELRSLYRPLHSRFSEAVKYGALAGLCLGTLRQGWLLYQHSQTIGPAVLYALAFCALLGASLAGGLAGAWVLSSRGRFKAAPDAAPENVDKYRVWTVILIAASCVLLAAGVGWARHVPLSL